MKLFAATALGFLLIGNAHAYNVLIDFEDSPLGFGSQTIESKGFNFFSAAVAQKISYWPGSPPPPSGTKVLEYCDAAACTMQTDLITMTQDGLAAFDLISLDLARSFYDTNIQLTGTFVGGGTISTSILVNSSTPTNFVLGSGWTNLQSLTISKGQFAAENYMMMDNILVSTVPIPAAVWLFASSLGLLGWMKRRA